MILRKIQRSVAIMHLLVEGLLNKKFTTSLEFDSIVLTIKKYTTQRA